MGRELKRVAIEFNWPLKKVWPGFVMPDHSEGNRSDCPDCKQGYSPDAQFLHDQWYGNAPFDPSDTGSKPFTPDTPAVYAFAKRQIERSPEFYLPGLSQFERLYRGTTLGETIPLLLQQGILREAQRLCDLFNACWSHHLDAHDVKALVDADRLWDFTRVSRTPEQRAIVEIRVAGGNNSWLPGPNGYLPTPEEVNTWSISGFGHDSINCGVCIKAKAERLGFAYLCPTCDGHCSVGLRPKPKPLRKLRMRLGRKPSRPPAKAGRFGKPLPKALRFLPSLLRRINSLTSW